MNLEDLEARVRLLEDIEQIKKLQNIYGYYLDNREWDEIIDLFSDDTESIEVAERGLFLGKAGVIRFFKGLIARGGEPSPSWKLGIHMQLQGVVDVDPGGKTAKGRWHGWLLAALPVNGLPRQCWSHGVYENEYIKEDGKWKFKKLHYNLTFRTPYEDGWLKTPVISLGWDESLADGPPTAWKPYPSGYVVPYHWKHPITGE